MGHDKGEKCLVDNQGFLKIIDFGCAERAVRCGRSEVCSIRFVGDLDLSFEALTQRADMTSSLLAAPSTLAPTVPRAALTRGSDRPVKSGWKFSVRETQQTKGSHGRSAWRCEGTSRM